MKKLTLTKPEGFIVHVTGGPGSGKTTLIGDMLINELEKGPCAYIWTRREGNAVQGCWQVLPDEVLSHPNFEGWYLETYLDLLKLKQTWTEKPRRALGLDTSTGIEQLIKAYITGDVNTDLGIVRMKNQYKEFSNRLGEFLEFCRDIARYTMLVSPATPTSYNVETGENDTGSSGTVVDAVKRMAPDGETNKSKLKLQYQCDHLFHIERKESPSTGRVTDYELVMENNLKLSTKNRQKLGKGGLKILNLRARWEPTGRKFCNNLNIIKRRLYVRTSH